VLAIASQAASADMSWKAIDRYSKDYEVLQKDKGVKFYKTPDAILQRQLQIWDQMIEKRSSENPLFKKVLDSQKAFAERAGKWSGDTNVNFRMAYNHFFAAKKV
jgi:TRAP-type mannitol/chloroaromatic compound transport system substrate-binding protein